jgi:hypothetical protein
MKKKQLEESEAGFNFLGFQVRQYPVSKYNTVGLVFTPQALIEIHHLDGEHRNNRYGNLAAVHRHWHDQIHGGYHELSQQLGTQDKSLIN